MYIHLWAPSFEGGDGISQFSKQLEQALTDLGIKHKAIARPKISLPLPSKLAKWVDKPLSLLFAFQIVLVALFSPPNLIISTHINFAAAAWLLKHLLGIQYVLIAHGIDVNEHLSSLRQTAIRSADNLWAVSHWTEKRLHKYQLAVGDVQIFQNTVDPGSFYPGLIPHYLKHRYGISPSTPVVLTVSRLDAQEGYKGYDVVIQAIPSLLSKYPDLHYVIVGRGSDAQRIQQLVSDLQLDNHVTLVGFIPNHELADHYRMANVFAMPSTGEGFGIVFLEALACGCPVLAGDQDGSVDALAQGELGLLVDPKNISAVAEGIAMLLNQQGSKLWFDSTSLHNAVVQRFGPVAFRNKLRILLNSSISNAQLS